MPPTERTYKGQVFRLIVASEPYTNLQGVSAPLDVWQARCMDCDREYAQRVPAGASWAWPTRRCSACIAGRRVARDAAL